jgi:cytidylate kinase
MEVAQVSAQRIPQGHCVVAIDGPAGSGKSTVSRRLATTIGARYLDTGGMYRAATWAVLRDGVDLADQHAVAKVVAAVEITVGTDPDHPSVTVDGVGVEADIRSPQVTGAVSAVAAVAEVRKSLVAAQREIINAAGRIVVEGRDIATAVAPGADLKVFLTASAAERARRRSAETTAELSATAADLDRRDRLDSTRVTDPLRQAADAIAVDTTELSIDEVVSYLVSLLPGEGGR